MVERVHSSGARVAFCYKPGYLRTYACFATNFGSVDDRFRIGGGDEIVLPDGVAHFLEHKMFEGIEEDAFQEFSRLGASANAFTGFNGTSYLFSCTDHFYECLSHLVRFVQSPHFTEENVEKEKGIIGQEICMYEDMPGWRVYFNLLEGMYAHHPVSKDIAGTVETISGIDAPMLQRCWESFYHPSNMILVLWVINPKKSSSIMLIACCRKKILVLLLHLKRSPHLKRRLLHKLKCVRRCRSGDRNCFLRSERYSSRAFRSGYGSQGIGF